MQKLYMNLRGNTNNVPKYNTHSVTVQSIVRHPCRQAMFNVMHAKGGGCSSCRG